MPHTSCKIICFCGQLPGDALLEGSVPARAPNIVLTMAGDMGFSDIGCYGGEIPTPNLERLARGGLHFTQFHNTARCCPTRASLLTGLYPHQAGMGHMVQDRGYLAYQAYLNDRCVTIAESAAPRRLHHAHELGGISTPLIVYWPGKIKQPGSLTHQSGHLIDLTATCIDLGNARYPETCNGQAITPLEGRSLRPVLEGKSSGSGLEDSILGLGDRVSDPQN